jgi:hypothetical protein
VESVYREQIAEDLDALSLAHNLVVPPILVVVTFSATRLQGCQSSVIKVAYGATQSRRNVDAPQAFAYGGPEIEPR